MRADEMPKKLKELDIFTPKVDLPIGDGVVHLAGLQSVATEGVTAKDE